MNFIKENTSKITRLIITHIAMSIFGLALFFTTNVMQPPTIMLIASIFSAVFYAAIVYSTMWEFGAKDKPAFDTGRLTNAGGRGFCAAIIAEVFWIILAIAYVIIAHFDINIASMIYVVEFLTSCCFTGIEVYIKNYVLANGSAFTPFVVAAVYILGSVFIAFVGMFGYVLGTKDMTIIPKKTNTKK